MNKIGPKGRKWLKAFHLLFAAMWTGGGVGLLLLFFLLPTDDGAALYGYNRGMRVIDDFLIIPGAMGCLLTGLIYSIWTGWGFFKHHWITVKWVITLVGVLFGTFFLGPWLNSLAPIARELGGAAINDPTYAYNLQLNRLFAPIQVASIVFALYISTLKPWRREKKKKKKKKEKEKE